MAWPSSPPLPLVPPSRRRVASRPPGRARLLARCALGGVLLSTSAPARADCIDDAARAYQVNAFVLRAIGWQESRLDPTAISRNADGSVDRGAFQINSVHWPELARQGIGAQALDDGCASAAIAAWHYRRQVERFGNTWAAVGAYHSRTPARKAWYANRIAGILVRWRVLSPAAPPFDPATAVGPAPAATRTARDRGGQRASVPTPPPDPPGFLPPAR